MVKLLKGKHLRIRDADIAEAEQFPHRLKLSRAYDSLLLGT